MPDRHVEASSTIPGLLPPRDVMRRLGISRPTLLRYEGTGRLEPVKLPSGHRRYRLEDVEAIERGEVAV